MDRIPKQGEFYRHFKDKLYQVITVAEHSETRELMVVYQALYGDYRTYARPLAMFVSEVDKTKYPDTKQKYRFEQVCLEAEKEPIAAMGSSQSNMQTVSQDTVSQKELNPNLLSFIEAETYEEKLSYLEMMRGKIGQAELDIICVTLDMNGGAGEIEEQTEAVKKYLLTQKRYDGARLR